MEKATKFNFKTLLVLFLSIALCLSTALSVACDNGESSSSSSSSSSVAETYPTDAQTLINGDFEFSTFTKKATEFPVGSSMNWVRSSDSITSSAVSSSYSSGIIDTDSEKYSAIQADKGLPETNPGTPFSVMSDDEKNSFADLDNYDANEDGKPAMGSKILMIHNEVKGAEIKGTAQKFTSSASLRVGKNEFAKITVWVKTIDLKSSFYADDSGEFGAYIAIQNTIGSTSKNPVIIKNINTNGAWVKYSFYLNPSDFATSNFKVVLGLGFGSKEIKRDYVEGYAFFDNASFELVTHDEIPEEAPIENFDLYTVENGLYVDAEAKDLTHSEGKVEYTNAADKNYAERVFAINHYRASELDLDLGSNLQDGVTHNNFTDSQAEGAVGYDSLSNVLTAIHGEGHEEKFPAFAEGNALYINHGDNYTSTSYVTKAFEVAGNTIVKYSFWVKAETKHPTQKGLTITLNDLGTGSAEAVNTTVASNITTNEYENENTENWIEYVLYVSNLVSNEAREFTLTFDFGTTAKYIENGIYDLTQGYAIVSQPVSYVISEEDFSKIDSSYTYTAKASLTADLPNGVESEDESNDSYTFSYGVNDKETVENGGIATNVLSYTGVTGQSTAVGGENENKYSDAKVLAGIVNSKHYKDFDFTNLAKIGENENVQPLMITTLEGAPSFGYIHTGSSLSFGSTLVVTVKVLVTGDAEAWIYLASTDALEQFAVIGHSGVNQDLAIKVTAADMPENGDWLTITLALTAGEKAVPYRVELWNGARDAATAAAGTVLFDQVTTSTSTSLKDLLAFEFNGQTAEETTYTRVDSIHTTITIDKNGDETETVETETFEPTTVVYKYSNALIVDLSTLVVTSEFETVEDLRDDSETSEESTETSEEESSFDWALQLTSIIIAAVLILLLLLVLGRMLYKKYLTKKDTSKSYYNRNSREKAGLAIEAKKAAKKAAEEVTEEVEEEVQPYDYDNMENNFVEEEVVSEAVVEEIPAEEEASEEPATEEATEEASEEPATEEEKPEEGSDN